MSTKRSTICLNMIVKNEAHIIHQTLQNLTDLIHFDYWVIGDNGSTDGTQRIIQDYFKMKKIPGELYTDSWVDFGHNRSEALKKAYNKTDYVFIFDADDSIHGKPNIPKHLNLDSYSFTFGHSSTIQYVRVLLVNNRRKWKFVGVLHEYIAIDEPGETTQALLSGDYFVVSGRSGARNNDPKKYYKDAMVLEKAYYKAIEEKNDISNRYVFYCAQSFRDAGMPKEAIEWYIKTIGANGWAEERYYACLELFDLHSKIEQPEKGFYYIVEAHKFSKSRVEATRILIQHYCSRDMHDIAYSYYRLIQDYYENHSMTDNMSLKLFCRNLDYDFFLPYFMIIVSEKTRNYETGVKMYDMLFKKKTIIGEWWMKNLFFNLQFFLDKVDKTKYPHFFDDMKDFLKIIILEKGIVIDHNLLLIFQRFGLDLTEFNVISPDKNTDSSNEVSNKVLIFAGFGGELWNQTYMNTHSLGGSETAVVNLSRCLPKHLDIYVGGNVLEEQVDNITYVNMINLPQLVKNNKFHTIIISRYISFFELFPYYSSKQVFTWAHDTVLSNYGCGINDKAILAKWNTHITGVVCLTEWHKQHFEGIYPELKNKIRLINNGINLSIFPKVSQKKTNSFMYSSCSERGLMRILQMWPLILEKMPDATLNISSYNDFPHNDDEHKMNDIVQKYDNITHLGKLTQSQLYKRMADTEFWLYPTNWPETSCITALEMLENQVICIYYPIAGLVNTLGDYGIPIQPGQEIETLTSLTNEKKSEIRQRGKEYADRCSWQHRATIWQNMIIQKWDTIKKPIWAIFYGPVFGINAMKDYFLNLNPDNIYDMIFTSDIEYMKTIHPVKITLPHIIHNSTVFDLFPTTEIELLNTEPLCYQYRLEELLKHHKMFPLAKLYDYSLSNIKILHINGIYDVTHLPYTTHPEEIRILSDIHTNTDYEYDFGILVSGTSDKPNIDSSPRRRQKIVRTMLNNGYSVNIICGWGIERDRELAKCRIILNIHGQLHEEDDPPLVRTTRIFEHIRCDRLLKSGFNIWSEDSDYLEDAFIKAYPNLRISKYDDFMDVNKMKNSLTYFELLMGGSVKSKITLQTTTPPTVDPSTTMISDNNKNTTNNNQTLMLDINKNDNQDSVVINQQHTKNASKKNNYCFIHSCHIKEIGIDRLRSFVELINRTGLIDKLEKVFIVNIGEPIVKGTFGDLYDIDNYSTNPQLYEIPTLQKMSYFASDNPNCNILYLHTKGISHMKSTPRYNNINDWINMMTYFLVEKHTACLVKLTRGFDTVGCNYYDQHDGIPNHYSGNFWWSSTNYLSTLSFDVTNKTDTEMWLCKNRPKYYSCHQSPIDHYMSAYPLDKYATINDIQLDLKVVKRKRKIIDCFIFYNELALLKYRLTLLNDYVDYFVISEATHTHIGKEKPLNFEQNKHMFSDFMHKIIYVVVDDFPHKYPECDIDQGQQWKNEKFQRNCIRRGIDSIKDQLIPDDILLINDLDEIVDPSMLQKALKGEVDITYNILEMDFYYYNLNTQLDHKWWQSKAITYGKLIELNLTCDEVRFGNWLPIIHKGGWHLSYFGDAHFISNKLQNFTHQEHNTVKMTDPDIIAEKIKQHKHLFSDNVQCIHVKTEDNTYLPPMYDVYLHNFHE